MAEEVVRVDGDGLVNPAGPAEPAQSPAGTSAEIHTTPPDTEEPAAEVAQLQAATYATTVAQVKQQDLCLDLRPYFNQLEAPV